MTAQLDDAAAAAESAGDGGAADEVRPVAGWRDGLPAALRDDPRLARHADLASLAKAYAHARAAIARKGAILPGEKDGPALRRSFRAAAGVPDTPEGYGAGNADARGGAEVAAWHALAHDVGLSPAQERHLRAWWDAETASEVAARTTRMAAVERDLRIHWGRDFEAKREYAARAADRCDLSARALERALEAGDGAALLRVLAALGEADREDRLIGASRGGSMRPTQAEIRGELGRIRAEGTAYWSRHEPGYRAAVDRALALEEMLVEAQHEE